MYTLLLPLIQLKTTTEYRRAALVPVLHHGGTGSLPAVTLHFEPFEALPPINNWVGNLMSQFLSWNKRMKQVFDNKS